MLENHFENLVRAKNNFNLSESQTSALQAFTHFFIHGNEDSIFLLKGHAGTGKTSLVAAIVNTLTDLKYKIMLLAPTGRAAKVLAGYSKLPAFTIHKKIYRQKDNDEGEGFFKLNFNTMSDTLFFVDEASMITNSSFDDSNFGSGRLLDDLIDYIYNGKNNRLILIGDTAQLPPIGLEISPALDANILQCYYNLEVKEVLLNQVMRQAAQSGIFYNATLLRAMIGSECDKMTFELNDFPDIHRISGKDLIDEIENCYSHFGENETAVICRSNKRANRYNEGIRKMILYRDETFSRGDRIMIVKNNYFWGSSSKKEDDNDFIANGEIAEVTHIGKYKDIYNHHFVKAEIEIDGYPDVLDTWVMLDTLTSEAPSLSQEENKQFYRAVEADYSDIPSAKKRFEKIRNNEFYNALQIKFAYAFTCHKAQGGQWEAVFIDQGYLTQDMINDEYWRWLYTAVTRARKHLYLVNFNKEFFNETANDKF